MHFYQIQLFIKGRLFFENDHYLYMLGYKWLKRPIWNTILKQKKSEIRIIMIIASIKNGMVVWTINLEFEVFVPDYSL